MPPQHQNYPIDEGYVKYACEWLHTTPLPTHFLTSMNRWRQQLYQLQLIGYDEQLAVGYGNISIRHPKKPAQFIISGTQTGHLQTLDNQHYTVVKGFDIEQNTLTCEGPIKASSESLTHAAVYLLNSENCAVIHAHHRPIWEWYRDKLPTTKPSVSYGTPEMALEIERLYRETNVAQRKALIMSGHQDGIITFGKTLEEAGTILLELLDDILLDLCDDILLDLFNDILSDLLEKGK